jgi:hypothetical protein
MVTYAVVHEWMSQVNLLIFLCVLSGLIVLSVILQRKRKFVWHGNTMLVLVMIAGLLTVVHMGPSFAWVVLETLKDFNWVAVLGIIHGLIGLVTLVSGVWLVGAWAFVGSSENQFCAPKRKLMWKILALWIISLGLGLVYYPLHLILG